MRTLALPLGWQLWGRHRLGLLGVLSAWLAATSAVRQRGRSSGLARATSRSVETSPINLATVAALALRWRSK